MTDAIGPSVSDVVRALTEARQASNRSIATPATQSAPAAGRSGHEGDRVTLSAGGQEALKIVGPDDRQLTPIPRDKLRLITPQDLRADGETTLQGIMADLGIEGDLEFSITVNGDGSIAVESSDPQAAALEDAINADPALQTTLRQLEMMSGLAHYGSAMKAALDGQRDDENAQSADTLDEMHALQDRMAASSFTLTMKGGVLTTAFVDSSGARFGGVAPEKEDVESA